MGLILQTIGLARNFRPIFLFPFHTKNEREFRGQIIRYRHSGKTRLSSIILVAPGLDTVPPAGWGAIETLVHEQAVQLSMVGFDVTVLNSRKWSHWFRLYPWRFKAWIVHFEPWIKRTRWFSRFGRKTTVMGCSHHSYFTQPDRWDEQYRNVEVPRLLTADRLLALTEEHAHIIKQFKPSSLITLLPNGSNAKFKSNDFGSNGIIVLGRVQPRKRQYELFMMMRKAGLTVLFVGEIADPRVAKLIEQDQSAAQSFVGGWTREEVIERLPSYNVLGLLSDGEGDALVLYEAQLAGLSLVISKQALGAQDANLPWITIVDSIEREDIVVDAFSTSWSQNNNLRAAIQEHAEQNYRWHSRIQPLLQAIENDYLEMQ